MKTKLLYGLFLTFFTISISFGQSSDVLVKVKWKSKSFENKVEIYSPANDLLLTLCDPNQCYVTTQLDTNAKYGVKYDLGCVANGNNYYIKLYDIADDGWSNANVKVYVGGVELINDDGTGANAAGQTLFFNVSGGEVNCSSVPDMDQDGLADYLDYDDDGDGITDGVENMGEDRFECTLPALEFENGAYDAAASTSGAGTVGAIYRFGNAIEGKDVLIEITELDNTTLVDIDDDTVDNASFLQTRLSFTGTGTPGARFKFTIVEAGTTTPAVEIYRINGITWDTDGTDYLQESLIYYNPAAYGTENPTALDVVDLGSNNIQISNYDEQTFNGFATYNFLRAYYQFLGNSFEIRMQAIKNTANTYTRLYALSFTQCEFLDFNANSLVIITGEDFDGDGKYNHLDIDSDNDGIPDNVEAQETLGYITPSGTVSKRGIDLLYGSGLNPIDTDLDNTPDILDLDTDSDGLLDIEENGMANSIIAFSDGDNDGLDLLFEGTNINDPLDVNDEIDNPSVSILPDADGDVFSGGDVDYRDLFNTNPPSSATLDFDGVDDYLTTPEFIEGKGELSIMAWVKVDAYATSMIIAGEEDGAKLWLSNGKPRLSITTQGSSIRHAGGGVALPLNEWHHVAGTYSNVTGKLTVYVDGVITHELSTGIIGNPIVTSASGLNTFEIGRLSKDVSDKQYFDGAIDEVRVFDSVLTTDQVQRMVYQEIQSNAGNVQGSVIDKDVIDITSNTKVQWNDLLAYYPMTDIKSSRTLDYSGNNRHVTLWNITSVQEQTAPMPYESDTDGAWTTEGTWKHGDVWDIEDVTSNKDWSIVRINSNVTTTSSHTNLGLIIEDNQSLIVTTDKEINNSWYLELNGDLDLQDDAQLVQGINSDLVTGANGKVLRRQDGASNVYWYTYMSSPVGLTGVTTLTDNNAATNNTNNTAFQFNTLKEGDGSAVEFTNSYNEVGKISTRWMYTFQNGLTYYDWASYSPSTSLDPGVGYIHKGTGNAGLEQEYIFEGKPNNGTILIAADDVDGDSSNESQPDVTLTSILVGNPYPSAIDAHKFIDDNAGIIEGTLYLWQQWAGDNHVLREYEGGYATLNKMAKIKAYQFDGLSGAITTSQLGTKTPTRYLAVGQAFMTEVIADGNIEFNNGQRIFKKEATGETVFFRGAEATQDNKEKGEKEEIELMHLDFTTSSGLKREIVLGFSSFTTEGYDYGYDAKMFETKTEDMFTMWKGHDMIAQAYPSIHPTNKIPLGLNVTGNHTYKIKATAFDNFKANQNVYLHDKLTNTYFDLRSKEAYGFTSERGRIEDRFEIVFKANQAKKDLETIIDNTVIYYNTSSDKLFVKGLEANAEQLTVVNMLGQAVMTQKEVSKEALNQGIHISDLSTGVYIVQITTGDLQQIEKKIIID